MEPSRVEVGLIANCVGLLEAAARQMAAGEIHLSLADALDTVLETLIGGTSTFSPMIDIGAAQYANTKALPHLVVRWVLCDPDPGVVQVPPHVWDRVIFFLRVLAGETAAQFRVCQAPKARHPDSTCGRLFLSARRDAKYCSPACRKRAERLRKRSARNVVDDS
ncbi:MAG TPA: hypothetical protein DGT21_23425 [Armatimonadetes bacterium]|jgi:hypothetical protein|nr:hypothetical protein [Armatimonadota bacterium]